MNRRQAIAEDLRKLGTGLMLAGVVGVALHPTVTIQGAALAGIIGVGFVALGVALTPEEE